ncbi:MAG: glycosyltransferase family 4 protein [Candidatus Omnitrophica bacterium]|nr:glycosyltransferase family 4 protein [Candidatus Omnitrophota bacterium]
MPNLLFCMTPGVGLNTWHKIGSLSRELKPYNEYVKRGWKVRILTFDRGPIPKLPEGITVVRFPNRRLLWFLPIVCGKLGRWADLIKTNQSMGSWYYTLAAKMWKKPVLLRCGYVHGEYLEAVGGRSLKSVAYQFLELVAFRSADYCQVPTKELSAWVQKRYGVNPSNINIVPNFVNTDIFQPLNGVEKIKKAIISVGRLEPVKRFDLLIGAAAKMPGASLTIVGAGSQKPRLKQMAKELNVSIDLPGNIANEKLPELLSSHEIFVMTSAWEGHPKALIEAMACGLPAVVSENTGTAGISENGVNCLLAKPDMEDIKNKVTLLFNDRALYEDISRNARKFACDNYSFEKIMLKEFSFLGKNEGFTFDSE